MPLPQPINLPLPLPLDKLLPIGATSSASDFPSPSFTATPTSSDERSTMSSSPTVTMSQEPVDTTTEEPATTTDPPNTSVTNTDNTATMQTTTSFESPTTTSTSITTTIPVQTTTEPTRADTRTESRTTKTKTTTTPYTTRYITTISVVTVTTMVPKPTTISGKITTVYVPETTTSPVPTIIQDPTQEPPLGRWVEGNDRGDGGGLAVWEITLTIAACVVVALAVGAAAFVGWIKQQRRRRDQLEEQQQQQREDMFGVYESTLDSRDGFDDHEEMVAAAAMYPVSYQNVSQPELGPQPRQRPESGHEQDLISQEQSLQRDHSRNSARISFPPLPLPTPSSHTLPSSASIQRGVSSVTFVTARTSPSSTNSPITPTLPGPFLEGRISTSTDYADCHSFGYEQYPDDHELNILASVPSSQRVSFVQEPDSVNNSGNETPAKRNAIFIDVDQLESNAKFEYVRQGPQSILRSSDSQATQLDTEQQLQQGDEDERVGDIEAGPNKSCNSLPQKDTEAVTSSAVSGESNPDIVNSSS
ncbi:hypothetical protein BGZ51_005170 [Haplosporangium sp. Z 767]|nr:hypothetical protein BGZ51_005170 [Haplosporangium sp. Z 767]